MEKIWNHIYQNELKVESNQNPCLLSKAPLNSKINREMTASIMFETFKVP